MTEIEMLQAMEKMLDKKLQPIQEDIHGLKSDMQEVKANVKHIKKQVDILYDWTDSLALKVKALENA